MPLVVLPAHLGDIEPIFDVCFAAFKDDPIMSFLFPTGVGRSSHTPKPDGVTWLEGKDKKKAEGVILPMWDMHKTLFGERRHVLPIYLEATKPGYTLYQHMGLERLIHVRVIHKPEVTGAPEDVEMPLMVKMPSTAKGISFEEWADKGYPENYDGEESWFQC
ncbi:acyl-CoA N-acyltransferase [Camillea tinctor]|nr:acyl-CoA N-acyltransferase [Camillea tinctor]